MVRKRNINHIAMYLNSIKEKQNWMHSTAFCVLSPIKPQPSRRQSMPEFRKRELLTIFQPLQYVSKFLVARTIEHFSYHSIRGYFPTYSLFKTCFFGSLIVPPTSCFFSPWNENESKGTFNFFVEENR